MSTGVLPVVLSGGSGTRLWPVSRSAFPKQFCDLFGEALLTRTLRRVRPLGEPIVIGGRDTEVLTRRILDELGLPGERAVFEPVGRNTAPAVALACHLELLRGGGDTVLGIFPADHLVDDQETFHRAVALAARCAADGKVATLGVRPTRPETGYGYIEVGDAVVAREAGSVAGGGLEARAAIGFREKPDLESARRYVEADEFLWNPGMFVFRAATVAEWFERLMPETWAGVRQVRPDLSNLAEVYDGLEPESFDYGIMERLPAPSESEGVPHVSIPCSFGWSDVGSWDEVARHLTSAERTVEVGARGNFVFPHRDRVYGLVGVEDLLVVDTADALLVARRGSSQRVKELAAKLEEAGRPEAAVHRFELRPWGRFEVLRDTEDFKSKILEVAPDRRLSYQSHRHRAEHWVVVRGHPEVVRDGEVLNLAPGDHVFIPRGAKHRIGNPGPGRTILVEIQLGDYFGEDDIVRYEDDFGRE